MFRVQVLNFLTALDIIDLYYSSKNFARIIFSIKRKLLFEPMDSVCNLKTWNSILDKNLSTFLVNVSQLSKDDFGIFYLWNLDCTLLVLIIFHCILSLHIFVFVKELVIRESVKNVTVIFALKFTLKFLTMKMFFMTSLFMNEILFLSLMNFFRECLFFFLDVCNTHSLYICTKKAKIFSCMYVKDIKTPNKLFKVFLSILITLYLN